MGTPLLPQRVLLRSLLLAAAAGIVLLGGLSFYRKVQTFQPTGAEVEQQAEGWVVTAVTAEGIELEPGDVLLLVGGELIGGRADLHAKLSRQRETDLLVMRGERVEAVAYERPPLRPDYPYLVLALTGVVYLLIGLYTVMRALNRQVLLFFLWCLSATTVYVFSARLPPFDVIDRALFVLEEAARLLLPPIALHFFLLFPRPLSEQRWFRRALSFLYLPATVLLCLQVDMIFFAGRFVAGTPSAAKLERLDLLELYLMVLFGFVSVLVLTSHLLRARRWEEERQVLWITLGMAGGYLPFLLLYLLPSSLGLRGPTLTTVLAVLPLGLVPLSFAYAILRYRLWDIAIIVRDVATYTLTLLLGIFGFSILNLLINRGIPEDYTLARSLMTFLAGLLMAGLLIPTKQGISSTLQRFHYRSSFTRRRALSQFGHDLLHERDLEQLSSSLLQELEEALDLDRTNLLLVEGPELKPVREDQGYIDLSMEALGEEIWGAEVETLSDIGLPDLGRSPSQQLVLHGYRYVFPLTVRDRRVGLVLVGYKMGEVPLSRDDIVLIRQLLNQVALAIENAQLLETLQRQLAEVQELKQFNEEIIESSPAGIAVLDRDEEVVSANLAFAAIVGVERSAARRRQLRDLLPLERIPTPEDGLVEVSFSDQQGRERQMQLSAATFLGSAEGLRVLVVHDVSERVRMERALEEKERLAALGMIAAGVAHEVNTPLTGISSYAQMLLQETPESDPRYATLRKVERQTFRAARIVNNLLEFARQREVEAEPVRLDAVVGECLELLAERFAESRIEVSFEPPGEPVIVVGNEGELHQIMNNLLLNAVDAMSGEGGRLSVAVSANGQWISTSIADTGPGIPPDQMSQIFQPFFSTKLQSGGTGLGLSISYEMVLRHGGDIEVENLPQRGCRFLVRLPAIPDAEASRSDA